MTINLVKVDNNPTQAIININGQNIAEMDSENFTDVNDMAASIRCFSTPHQFTAECIFGCSHSFNGYLISIINDKALSTLTVKSLSPDFQIVENKAHCDFTVVTSDENGVMQFGPRPVSMIQIFVPTATFGPSQN